MKAGSPAKTQEFSVETREWPGVCSLVFSSTKINETYEKKQKKFWTDMIFDFYRVDPTIVLITPLTLQVKSQCEFSWEPIKYIRMYLYTPSKFLMRSQQALRASKPPLNIIFHFFVIQAHFARRQKVWQMQYFPNYNLFMRTNSEKEIIPNQNPSINCLLLIQFRVTWGL